MLIASKVLLTLKSRSIISRETFLHCINMLTNVRTLRARSQVKPEAQNFQNGSFKKTEINAQVFNSSAIQVRKKSTNKKDLKTNIDDVNNAESVNVSDKIQSSEIEGTSIVAKGDIASKLEKKSSRKRSGNRKIKTELNENATESVPTSCEISIKSEPLDDTVSNKEQPVVEILKSSRKRSIKTESEPFDIKINICDTEGTDNVYMDSSGAPISATKSPRKRRQVKSETNVVKSEKEAKTIKREVADIEDAAWEPDNWKEVWENILKMRKMYVAPVDSLGCEECPDKGVTPEVHRYQTLISVMLSSQTRDEVTFAATQRLIEHGLTVDNILKTPDEKIGKLIYPAGFWKSKIQYIKRTTQILKDQYGSDIPRTFKELCKLPGVGPKMANIVMSVGWNDTVGIAVDTHVHQISNRLGWVKKPTKEPEQTRKALESWLPKDLWKDGSFHLVGFGQTICKPVNPKCHQCFNVQLCPFGKSQSKLCKTKK
ncbi:endonuclease III-like protein 1 isoform X2 [Uloborus diversus]|uniref:endonuclease III-like protein 1 isoform X2 n=1 Tax=Uloborus diversus TaxID=327109 RepID=UPI0024092BB2|nr:endonuclease III-like protein 1 isoform X2 [Uloborus diversus]